jgi:hypothetical protein
MCTHDALPGPTGRANPNPKPGPSPSPSASLNPITPRGAVRPSAYTRHAPPPPSHRTAPHTLTRRNTLSPYPDPNPSPSPTPVQILDLALTRRARPCNEAAGHRAWPEVPSRERRRSPPHASLWADTVVAPGGARHSRRSSCSRLFLNWQQPTRPPSAPKAHSTLYALRARAERSSEKQPLDARERLRRRLVGC